MPDYETIKIDEDGAFIITDTHLNGDNITIDSSMISGLTVDTIDLSNITVNSSTLDPHTITWDNWSLTPVEFEDNMPDVAKVEDMCNDYPALRKAYENFKTIYKMVHQDWQGKQDAEDQFPF